MFLHPSISDVCFQAASRSTKSEASMTGPSILAVEADTLSEVRSLALEKLHDAGAVMLRRMVPEESLEKAKSALKPVVDRIVESFGAVSDPLTGSLAEELGIVKSPFVGDGRRNVYFDPQESKAHVAMAELVRESLLENVLQAYAGEAYPGEVCSLLETGFCVTRPGGDGLAWHTDGVGEGEMTILMSLTGLTEEQGCMGLVPSSHKKYCSAKVEGGKEEQKRLVDEGSKIWCPYRPGVPILLDGRTLHCARENLSDQFRVLLWWTYRTNI